MKKTIFTLIALCALSFSAWGTVTQQQIGSFYYELDDATHTATLIKNPYAAESWQSYDVYSDLVISATVNDGVADYTVTTIGENAFQNGGMPSLVIEEGVINIADNAFWACSNLKKATLPSTVSSIGNYAFQTSGLTKITLNATTPPTLGDYVFDNVSSLAHIYVPSASVNAYKAAWSDLASIIGVAPVSVEWNEAKVSSVNVSCDYGSDPASQTVDGITVTATAPAGGDYSQFKTYVDEEYHTSTTSISINNGGTITFTPTSGKLKSIVIDCGYHNHSDLFVTGSGWSWNGGDDSGQLIWTSATAEGASSVVLACSGESFYFNITSAEFVFAEEPTPVDPSVVTSTITWETTDLATVNVEMGYNSTGQSQYIKDIIVTNSTDYAAGKYCHFNTTNGQYNGENWPDFSMRDGGSLTFAPAEGKLTKVVITCDEIYPSNLAAGSGWVWDGSSKLTWSDENGATSVVLAGDGTSTSFSSGPIRLIEFTVVTDAATPDPNSVTWNAVMLKAVDLLRYTNMYSSYSETYISHNDGPSQVEMKDVVATISATTDGSYAQFSTRDGNTNISVRDGGTLTFSSTTREFESIVINYDGENGGYGSANYPTEWNSIESTLTWEGEATNSVVLEDALVTHITSIVFTYATAPEPDPMPSGPSFIWEQRQVKHVKMNCSNGETKTTPVIKNIITSLTRTSDGNCYFGEYGYGKFEIMDNCGTLTFQSIVGDLTGIIITCSTVYYANDLPAGWRYDSETGKLIWVGTPVETVTLSGDLKFTITAIEFFYDPAPTPRLGETVSDGLYEITGAHTAKVIHQTHGQTYNIPSYVEEDGVKYYITEIDESAFANMDEEGNVYVNGENLAKIGAYAFKNSPRLTLVAIYSKVLDEIGEEAFMNCKLMSFFECHTAVPPVLGRKAFDGTTYMNHIVVNQFDDIDVVYNYKNASGWSTYADKIIEMGGEATPGEQFFFHNQMTTGWYAVSSGSPREAKVLPYIEEVGALYPRSLEGTLVIPEEVPYMSSAYSVTGIGANAYKDSTRFNMVLIPQSVKTIESGAFLNCTGVEKVFFLWDDPSTITWADGSIGAEFKTASTHGTKIFVPAGSLDAYKLKFPAWADCMFGGELVDATATQDPNYPVRYYRTFYDSQTDYMMPPSVWAHAGYVQGNEFILRPVAFDGQILPRGTAVVLESETPDYRLIPTGNTEPLYTGPNDLIGTDVAFPRSDLGANADKVYVLGRQATINEQSQVGMGMYRYTGTNLGAHKAYMILDISGGSAPARFLFRHEDQATDVENVQENELLCTKIIRDGQFIIIRDGKEYNAQGQIIK